MNKTEFKALLNRSLDVAASSAERRLGTPVSRTFEIQFHGFAPTARTLTPDQVADELYLGPDRFYRVVDVGVVQVGPARTIVIMIVSGHEPSSFDKTWNQPVGAGPFKQIESAIIRWEGDAV